MKDTDWEIVYELYKTPNITKVANRLYMTQPSLTKRLKYIEEEFHIMIVDRTPKGVKFTPEGELLAKRAQHYMEFLRETKREMMMFREEMEGTIEIGSAYSYHRQYLNDILSDYASEHPHVNMEVVNDASNLLFRKACEKELDAVFIRGDYEGPVEKRLVSVDYAYVLSKGEIDLTQLPNIPRIDYKSNDRTRELIQNWWDENFDELPLTGVSVSYIDFAWKLVDKGMGYACCFLPENYKNEHQLTLTPMRDRNGNRIARNTWFVYSEIQRENTVLKEFVDFIEENIVMK